MDVLKTFINLYRNIYRKWYLLTATWPNSQQSIFQSELNLNHYNFTDLSFQIDLTTLRIPIDGSSPKIEHLLRNHYQELAYFNCINNGQNH